MAKASYGWDTSPVHEVQTPDGPVRVSVGIKTGGRFAGHPLVMVHHADGTWSMVRLDNEGAILAAVQKRTTKNGAWRRMRAALGVSGQED